MFLKINFEFRIFNQMNLLLNFIPSLRFQFFFFLLKTLRLKSLFMNLCVYLWLFLKDGFLERVHLMEGIHHTLRSEECYQLQALVCLSLSCPLFAPPASPSIGKCLCWAGSRLSTSCWFGCSPLWWSVACAELVMQSSFYLLQVSVLQQWVRGNLHLRLKLHRW